MSYTVIARKWRPQSFSELIGQKHVAKTLQNAIINDRVAHAYIFTGSRGIGKTSAARIFAKALNCSNISGGEPCNSCPSCQEISTGRGMDIIEIDGASNNSVDNIRDLRDNIRFSPTSGKYKIYIIDEVHMLSKGAFNALLKTLEEPPKHAIFIFATTEIHKVLPTILSRCQRFDFKRISIKQIIDRLSFICTEESIKIDDDALLQIAKKADGGMRDSQSILDQLISFCGDKITLNDVNASLGYINQDLVFQIVDSFIEKDTGAVIGLINVIFTQGLDLNELVHSLEEHLRNILVIISTADDTLIDTLESHKNNLKKQAKHFNENDILRIVEVLQKTEYSIKTGQNPKLKLELALAKICHLDKSIDISELLSVLKKKNLNKKEKSSNTTKVVKVISGQPQAQKELSKDNNSQQAYSVSETEENFVHSAPDTQLEQIQNEWKELSEYFKLTKPALYNCLYQSRIKTVNKTELCVLFDNTHNGRLSAGMFRNSIDFIEKSFHTLNKKAYQIKIEFANFEKLGITVEFNDMDSIVKRMRKKNPLFDELISSFNLKPVSFGD